MGKSINPQLHHAILSHNFSFVFIWKITNAIPSIISVQIFIYFSDEKFSKTHKFAHTLTYKLIDVMASVKVFQFWPSLRYIWAFQNDIYMSINDICYRHQLPNKHWDMAATGCIANIFVTWKWSKRFRMCIESLNVHWKYL